MTIDFEKFFEPLNHQREYYNDEYVPKGGKCLYVDTEKSNNSQTSFCVNNATWRTKDVLIKEQRITIGDAEFVDKIHLPYGQAAIPVCDEHREPLLKQWFPEKKFT